MTLRKTVVAVCPGRGTYNKTELGYLRRFHADKPDIIGILDAQRVRHRQSTVSELDSRDDFNLATYSNGENASPLIFTCSLCDFLSIDEDRFDVVAVTGNSMGWYTALVCAGSLSAEQGAQLVDAMGMFMQAALIGGQIIHTMLDENWRTLPGRRDELLTLVSDIHSRADCELYVSIELGGMIVLAGNKPALDQFATRAPAGPGRFPLRLYNHAAFHSPLQLSVAERAKSGLPANWIRPPTIPLIDGRGTVWRPLATNAAALWDYTLGTQVVDTYDFTAAVQVAVKEFSPDYIAVLGPGDTLGGAVAQSLIGVNWRDLDSKTAFSLAQSRDPYVISMGRPDQRDVLVSTQNSSNRRRSS